MVQFSSETSRSAVGSPPPHQAPTLLAGPRKTLAHPSAASRVIADYFGLIFRNVIGWVFILGSLTIGAASPIPGNVPIMFLIGFALITFPGKRRLLSRVMRGTQMSVEPWPFSIVVIAISVMLTMAALWFMSSRYEAVLTKLHLQWFDVVGVCIVAAGVSWGVLRLGLAALNWYLRRVPGLRRYLRPWLRQKGIKVLPPRRSPIAVHRRREEPIIELHDIHRRRARELWTAVRPWLKRVLGLAITGWIFARILTPVFKNWHNPAVQARLAAIEPARFIVAMGMFAIFLFVFRALAWRQIVREFGFTLPIPAAVRIWITSELARYVPGSIFQVVSRVMLAKPYGIRGTVTSVTQVLELAIFLLANIILAISCLLYFGSKHLQGQAQLWLRMSFCLLPVLLLLLHPTICYGIINRVMKRLGKPIIEQRLGGRSLLGILGWNILGLLWQTAAVYVLTEHALGLKLAWWWVLAGAYSLAWCAGFLAFWAPGGIGVRELVFVAAMNVALPRGAREQFAADPAMLTVFLSFLSILLRLWATAGELLVASVAYIADYRGVLGPPSATSRVPRAATMTSA
jgi:hypothetical protein